METFLNKIVSIVFMFCKFAAVEEKKIEIMEKATEVFMRYGIKSVTMDDLAKSLGVSKKTIYKYFSDKNDLVKHIVKAKTEIDKVVCETSKVEAVNAIDELILISKAVSELFGQLHTSVFFDLKKYHRDAWDIMEAHKNDYVRDQIIDNINRGISEGLYRKNLDSDIISTVYLTTMDAIFDGLTFNQSNINLSVILIEVIRFQIRGMANDRGLSYLKARLKTEEND